MHVAALTSANTAFEEWSSLSILHLPRLKFVYFSVFTFQLLFFHIILFFCGLPNCSFTRCDIWSHLSTKFWTLLSSVWRFRVESEMTELRSCVNREVGLGSHSLPHSSPVPNEPYGSCGRKAPWKKKKWSEGISRIIQPNWPDIIRSTSAVQTQGKRVRAPSPLLHSQTLQMGPPNKVNLNGENAKRSTFSSTQNTVSTSFLICWWHKNMPWMLTLVHYDLVNSTRPIIWQLVT